MTVAYNNHNFAKHEIEAFYHMTHIDNISSIMNNGLLAHGNPYQAKDISDNQVNSRRSRVEPVYGRAIHSYVPFYFNPKNAMLYRRKEMQNEIVILVFGGELISSFGAIFTDGNASSDDTRFFNNRNALNQLDWNCLNDWSWCNHRDGKRTRMAEVLVPNHVGIERLNKIVCNSYSTYLMLLNLNLKNIEIEINSKFYF